MNSVFPGNTYDYSPFNASVQAQFYNNLYGAGNCVDQIKDCASRGIDEICAAAVRYQRARFILILTTSRMRSVQILWSLFMMYIWAEMSTMCEN